LIDGTISRRGNTGIRKNRRNNNRLDSASFFDRRQNQPPRQYLHPKNMRNNNRLDRPTAWEKVHFAADPQKPDFPSSISETGSQQPASPSRESGELSVPKRRSRTGCRDRCQIHCTRVLEVRIPSPPAASQERTPPRSTKSRNGFGLSDWQTASARNDPRQRPNHAVLRGAEGSQ
jgi:hypothetical protein